MSSLSGGNDSEYTSKLGNRTKFDIVRPRGASMNAILTLEN